jgi:PPM family protein phosphatase
MSGMQPEAELDGPFLAFAQETPTVLSWSTPHGRLAAATCSRPGRATPNEDALAVFPVPDGLVLVAVDGVGGSADAAEAARILLVELHARLATPAAEPHPPESIRGRILDALENSNRRLLDEYRDAAAVAAIAVIEHHRMRTIHVGDCTALLFGQRGKLKYQTIAHSPVGFALEAGWIGEEEALEHEERHLISNAVGARDMRIEIGPWIDLARHDRLLLGSDGLFDNLTLDEIIETSRRGPVRRALNALIARGRSRMEGPHEGFPSKPDDLTALLFAPGGRSVR